MHIEETPAHETRTIATWMRACVCEGKYLRNSSGVSLGIYLTCSATICLPMLGAITAYTPLASVTDMRASLEQAKAHTQKRGKRAERVEK